MHLTAAEHSSLLYLLDAIKVAPNKAGDLIKLAKKLGINKGKFYNKQINKLQKALDNNKILEVSKKMREDMR